jgi:hypothetical protein
MMPRKAWVHTNILNQVHQLFINFHGLHQRCRAVWWGRFRVAYCVVCEGSVGTVRILESRHNIGGDGAYQR